MSKLFAIFIPLLTVIVSTLLIVLFRQNPVRLQRNRSCLIYLSIGVLVFLIGLGLLSLYNP